MTPLELAKQYLNLSYSGSKLDKLREILDADCRFEGPFYNYATSLEYIDALKHDPPVGMKISILHEYENDDSACVVYQFVKGDIDTLMTQLFVTRQDKIQSIRLNFDTAPFL